MPAREMCSLLKPFLFAVSINLRLSTTTKKNCVRDLPLYWDVFQRKTSDGLLRGFQIIITTLMFFPPLATIETLPMAEEDGKRDGQLSDVDLLLPVVIPSRTLVWSTLVMMYLNAPREVAFDWLSWTGGRPQTNKPARVASERYHRYRR